MTVQFLFNLPRSLVHSNGRTAKKKGNKTFRHVRFVQLILPCIHGGMCTVTPFNFIFFYKGGFFYSFFHSFSFLITLLDSRGISYIFFFIFKSPYLVLSAHGLFPPTFLNSIYVLTSPSDFFCPPPRRASF